MGSTSGSQRVEHPEEERLFGDESPRVMKKQEEQGRKLTTEEAKNEGAKREVFKPAGDGEAKNKSGGAEEPDVIGLSTALASVHVEDKSEVSSTGEGVTVQGSSTELTDIEQVSVPGVQGPAVTQDQGNNRGEEDSVFDSRPRGLVVLPESDDDADQPASTFSDERAENDGSDEQEREHEPEHEEDADEFDGDIVVDEYEELAGEDPIYPNEYNSESSSATDEHGPNPLVALNESDQEDTLVESNLFAKFVYDLNGGGRVGGYPSTWLAQYLKEAIRMKEGYGEELHFLLQLVLALQELLMKTWSDMDNLRCDNACDPQKEDKEMTEEEKAAEEKRRSEERFKHRKGQFDVFLAAVRSGMERDHVNAPLILNEAEIDNILTARTEGDSDETQTANSVPQERNSDRFVRTREVSEKLEREIQSARSYFQRCEGKLLDAKNILK